MCENSLDLLKKPEAYADIDPPGICWLRPDDGETYCWECAEEQINYFGNGISVDGGWGGQESDCCVHCETCRRVLDYSLTTAGVEYELEHFEKARFRKPLYRDDAAHIVKMLEASPDDKRVIAVARRAVRAIKVQARVRSQTKANHAASPAIQIDGGAS